MPPKEFPTSINSTGKQIITGQLISNVECYQCIIRAAMAKTVRENLDKVNSSKNKNYTLHKIEEFKTNLTNNLLMLMKNLQSIHNMFDTGYSENANFTNKPEAYSKPIIVPGLLLIIVILVFYVIYLLQKVRTL